MEDTAHHPQLATPEAATARSRAGRWLSRRGGTMSQAVNARPMARTPCGS